jgi:hypothetical protein
VHTLPLNPSENLLHSSHHHRSNLHIQKSHAIHHRLGDHETKNPSKLVATAADVRQTMRSCRTRHRLPCLWCCLRSVAALVSGRRERGRKESEGILQEVVRQERIFSTWQEIKVAAIEKHGTGCHRINFRQTYPQTCENDAQHSSMLAY